MIAVNRKHWLRTICIEVMNSGFIEQCKAFAAQNSSHPTAHHLPAQQLALQQLALQQQAAIQQLALQQQIAAAVAAGPQQTSYLVPQQCVLSSSRRLVGNFNSNFNSTCYHPTAWPQQPLPHQQQTRGNSTSAKSDTIVIKVSDDTAVNKSDSSETCDNIKQEIFKRLHLAQSETETSDPSSATSPSSSSSSSSSSGDRKHQPSNMLK